MPISITTKYGDKLVRMMQAGGKQLLPNINDKKQIFLSWCCADFMGKEIANRKGISSRTVESYADILCGKLGEKEDWASDGGFANGGEVQAELPEGVAFQPIKIP